jgi:hypothetical protein
VDRGQRVWVVVPDQAAEMGPTAVRTVRTSLPDPQVFAPAQLEEGDDRGEGGEQHRKVAAQGVHIDPTAGGVSVPVVLEEDPGPGC